MDVALQAGACEGTGPLLGDDVMMWCVLRQFNPVSMVHKEEFSLMRASFYFTHHIDSGTSILPICTTTPAGYQTRDHVQS